MFSKNGYYRVYSSKEKFLVGFLKFVKNYYKDSYEQEIKSFVDLGINNTITSDENKNDLINYLKGKEYQGIFTLDDLNSWGDSFKFRKLTLDSEN